MSTRLGVGNLYGRPKFVPDRLPGIQLWYDVSRPISLMVEGAGVAAVKNLVAVGPDLVQATATLQPLYRGNGINGRPAIEFDGVDDYLAAGYSLSPAGNDNPGSIAIVLHQTVAGVDIPYCWGSAATSYFELAIDPTTSNNYHWNKQDSSSNRDLEAPAGPVPDQKPHIFVMSHTGLLTTCWFDGDKYADKVSQNVTNMATVYVCIGRRLSSASAFHFQGLFGELLVSTAIWTDYEAELITRYLSKKWEVPADV